MWQKQLWLDVRCEVDGANEARCLRCLLQWFEHVVTPHAAIFGPLKPRQLATH